MHTRIKIILASVIGIMVILAVGHMRGEPGVLMFAYYCAIAIVVIVALQLCRSKGRDEGEPEPPQPKPLNRINCQHPSPSRRIKMPPDFPC